MPVIRYTLCIEGDTFSETDTFERTTNAQKLIETLILLPLQEHRKKLNEPPISLTRVEVLNPHVHLHTWTHTHISKMTMRSGYECQFCKITGHKPYAVYAQKEMCELVKRDEAFKKDKFALCRDALKELPKKLTFQFRPSPTGTGNG